MIVKGNIMAGFMIGKRETSANIRAGKLGPPNITLASTSASRARKKYGKNNTTVAAIITDQTLI